MDLGIAIEVPWVVDRARIVKVNDGAPETGPRRPHRPIAVAVQGELAPDAVPRVVASGRGVIADQILELAFANGVKVREDADLAEVLAAVEIDSPIPVGALVAVAEILTRVYQANGRLVGQEDQR